MAVGSCVMEEPAQRQSDVPRPIPREGRPRGKFARRLWRWTRIPVLAYLGLIAMLFALQTDLIFPGAKRQGQPDTVVRPRADEQLVTLSTPRGDKVVALFGPALTPQGAPLPDAKSRPTLLYFYGNAMCIADAVDQLEHFRRLGVNVMIPDYLGYGMSGGKASESGCQTTADVALDHLRTRKDLDPKQIVAAGWSLGGAVAIDLASRETLAGLIAFSTFTSMGDMARANLPFLPSSLLLRHRFDNLSKIPHIHCPILIGHGRRDELIPYAMFERLSSAAKAPTMKFTVEGAGHNDFFAIGGEQVLRAIRAFLDQIAPEN